MKQLLFRHWDLLLSVLIGAESLQLLPSRISLAFSKEFYLAELSTVALVFSVVFAAITLLASVGSEDFLAFLEEEDSAFSAVLDDFRLVLTILFCCLVSAIASFTVTTYRLTAGHVDGPAWHFAGSIILLSYALTSSQLVASDVIRFAKLRAKFILEKVK